MQSKSNLDEKQSECPYEECNASSEHYDLSQEVIHTDNELKSPEFQQNNITNRTSPTKLQFDNESQLSVD